MLLFVDDVTVYVGNPKEAKHSHSHTHTHSPSRTKELNKATWYKIHTQNQSHFYKQWTCRNQNETHNNIYDHSKENEILRYKL